MGGGAAQRRIDTADRELAPGGFRSADRLLREQQADGPDGRRQVQGVTTLLALAFDGGDAVVAHVGDSRCYRLRAGRLEQLTKDHTLLAQSRPHVTSEELEDLRPLQELALSRSLGGGAADVDVVRVPLEPGDVYLVCSNGLVEGLGESDLQQILQAWSDPRQASDRLVNASRDAGALDDITAIVVAVSAGRVAARMDPAPTDPSRDTPWTSGPSEFAAV